MALRKNAKIKGVTVEIGGNATGLGKAISDAQGKLTSLNQSLKLFDKNAEAAFQSGADSSRIFADKQQALAEAVKEAEKQLNGLIQAQEEANRQIAEGTNHEELDADAMRRLATEIQRAEIQLQNLRNEQQLMNNGYINAADAARQAAAAQRTAAEQAAAAQREMAEQAAAAQQRLAQAQSELQTARNNLGTFVTHTTSFDNLKTSVMGVVDAFKALATASTAALTAAGGYVVNVGTKFEASMSKVQALSGATGEDFDKLSSAAKEMGATTSKTASQAADALGYMALAGWKTEQMLGGLEPILRASEAGGMDLATCSDLVTDSMSAMGIAVEDLGHYLDVVAKAQSSSNTSMQQLLDAYVQCGGTLRNLNVDIEESATLLGALANRGKKGAEAGTALNSIMVNLIGANRSAKTAMDELGVSAWDSNGNFIGLKETLELLGDTLKNLDDDELENNFVAKIGGKTQLDTLQALLSGVNEEYDDLFKTLNDCAGASEDAAKTMQQNLTGSMTMFGSALEGVGIEIYESFKEPLTQAVNEGTDMLSGLVSRISDGDLSGTVEKIAKSFGKLVLSVEDFAINDGLPALLNFLEFVANHGDAVVAALKGIVTYMAADKLVKPVTSLVAVISDLRKVRQAMAAVTAAETAATATNTAAQTANAAATGAAAGAQSALNAAMKANIWAAVASLVLAAVTAVVSYVQNIETLDDKLQEIEDKYDEAAKAAKDRADQADDEIENVQQLAGNYERLRKKYEETGEGLASLKKAAEDLQAAAPEFGELLDEQTNKYRALGDEINNVVEAMRMQRDVQKGKDLWSAEMDKLDETIALFNEARQAKMDYMTETAEIARNNGMKFEDVVDHDYLAKLDQAVKDTDAARREAEKKVKEAEKSLNAAYDKYAEVEEENAKNAALPVAEYVNQYVESMKNATAQSFDEYYAWINDRFAEFEQKYNELKDSFEVGDINDEAYRQGLTSLLDEYGIKGLDIYHKYYKELKKLNNQYNKEIERQNKEAADQAEKDRQNELKEEEEQRKKSLENAQKFYSEQAKAHNQTVKKMTDEYNKGMSDIEKERQSFLDRISNTSLNDGDGLTNLDAERRKIAEYRKNLEDLKGKNLSEDMLNDIKSMPLEEAMQLAKNLNSLKDDKLKLWMDDYKALDKERQNFTSEEYDDDVAAFRKNFASKIEDVTVELTEAGKNGGINFAAAFLEGIEQGIGGGELSRLLFENPEETAAARAALATGGNAAALTSGQVTPTIQGGDVVFAIDGNVIGKYAVKYINDIAAQGGSTINF
jgi:TP901 family phage tail tape measure protein